MEFNWTQGKSPYRQTCRIDVGDKAHLTIYTMLRNRKYAYIISYAPNARYYLESNLIESNAIFTKVSVLKAAEIMAYRLHKILTEA